jgi:hypothetical protein
MPDIRSEISMLVVFVDLTRFGAQSQRVDDVELADTIDTYYAAVSGSNAPVGRPLTLPSPQRGEGTRAGSAPRRRRVFSRRARA